MTIAILYLWITTAAARIEFRNNWVPSGEYASMQACDAAIARLAVNPKLARCVDTGRAAVGPKGGE